MICTIDAILTSPSSSPGAQRQTSAGPPEGGPPLVKHESDQLPLPGSKQRRHHLHQYRESASGLEQKEGRSGTPAQVAQLSLYSLNGGVPRVIWQLQPTRRPNWGTERADPTLASQADSENSVRRAKWVKNQKSGSILQEVEASKASKQTEGTSLRGRPKHSSSWK